MPAKRSATLGLVLAFLSASSALIGCSRNPIEAVNLANEGDKARAVNPDEAISKYEQAVQLDPTNHRILSKLVLAYKKKEDWAKMAERFSKNKR